MTGNWGALLAKLIPLALVIAVSPLTIIPAVLVLHAPRPRPTAIAFLTGWVLGLAALTGIFVAGSGLFAGLHKAPPTWASWLRVVLGTVLILWGIYQWVIRNRESEPPRWMRAFDTITPRRAGIVALVLTVVRLEVSLLVLAAGLAIGTSDLRVAGKWLFSSIFVVIAASSVAIPIVGYLSAGDRFQEKLNRLKDWMEKNHAAMLAVVLVLIGAMVLHNGVSAL